MTLQEAIEECSKITDEWVDMDSYSDSEYCLDGYFTLDELKALVKLFEKLEKSK